MRYNNHYDVIIIGTGAGGGTLAYALAASGKRILLIEKGDYLPREKDNWNARAVFMESKYKAKEKWYDKNGQAFPSGIHYYVGGNTKFFGAAFLRFRKEDFGEVQHYSGVSPAWPLTYEDFEPHYSRAEHLYCVHGKRGIDPYEPPASSDYLYAPLNHSPAIKKLSEDLSRTGLNPFPLPVGIMANGNSRTGCILCDTCDGFPCLLNAKADSHVVCIEPALNYPNVRLVTQANVKYLETDSGGQSIKKVHTEIEGVLEELSADIVVVACGAINSAALLLRSANDKHPHGLANSSGVVGRYYMGHIGSAVIAISKYSNETVFQKTLGLNDFYFGTPDWPYPMGQIQLLGKIKAEIFQAETFSFLPYRLLSEIAKHGIDFSATSEDLPDRHNRVSLTPQGKIRLSYTPNNLMAHKKLVYKLKKALDKIGFEAHLFPSWSYPVKKFSGTGHQCGTIRFGNDPKTSALDLDCKAHDLDNLYVADASFFPSSAAVNPSLTIIANSLRIADHIRERMN